MTQLLGTTGSILDKFKHDVLEGLNHACEALESEQAKVTKALFNSLSMEQRDTFCKSLQEQGVAAKRIEKITGKSQPTINRHLNGKNS